MISKEVLVKTQKKLIRINMLVVSSFLILLCIFTYIYFSYINNSNINRELEEELSFTIGQLQRIDNKYDLLYGFDEVKVKDPKNMVYIYVNDDLINPNNNPYFGDEDPNDEQQNKQNGFYTDKRGKYTFRICNYKYSDYNIKIIREINSELNLVNSCYSL